MGINLKKIFPNEFKELENRGIHCDNLKTDILEYMLLDHLGILSEFKDIPLHFSCGGMCQSWRFLTIVPPDYKPERPGSFPYPNVKYTDQQKEKINLFLQSIASVYSTGNATVEINSCNDTNEYSPYAHFPTELYQRALQKNALMEATDEKHVQSLTKTEFDALKKRVQAFIFPDKKQDEELIAQIHRIMDRMDEIYSSRVESRSEHSLQKRNSGILFQPALPKQEQTPASCFKMIP